MPAYRHTKNSLNSPENSWNDGQVKFEALLPFWSPKLSSNKPIKQSDEWQPKYVFTQPLHHE